VAVVWMAGAIFVNASKDNGVTFSPAEKIAGIDPCECCASRAAFSTTGALLIDYRDKAGNVRDMHVLARAPRSESFAKQKISQTPWEIAGCPMTGTFLSRGRDEEIMAWETKGKVFYSRLDSATGKRKTKEIEVAERGKWPVAIAGKNGTVLVSWKEADKLRWQEFNSQDEKTGNGGAKASPNSTRHAGVFNGEEFLLID
jgi:hypothetical protein